MIIYEIRVIASNMGIDPKKMNKTDLIRSIQVKQGNSPCFKTAGHQCKFHDCHWRSDCLQN
jgi:hypothetical protein